MFQCVLWDMLRHCNKLGHSHGWLELLVEFESSKSLVLVGVSCMVSEKGNGLSSFPGSCVQSIFLLSRNQVLLKEVSCWFVLSTYFSKSWVWVGPNWNTELVFLWFFGCWDLSCARILNKIPREGMNEARCLGPKEQDLGRTHISTGSSVIPGEVSVMESTNFQWFCRDRKNLDECWKASS